MHSQVHQGAAGDQHSWQDPACVAGEEAEAVEVEGVVVVHPWHRPCWPQQVLLEVGVAEQAWVLLLAVLAY